MNTTGLKNLLQCAGPDSEVMYINFTPAATTAGIVVNESHGFTTTVTRSGAGVYVTNLARGGKNIEVLRCGGVLGDTNFHTYEAAVSASAGTVTVTHKTVAYASIASGPAASDTSGAITVAVLVRKSS